MITSTLYMYTYAQKQVTTPNLKTCIPNTSTLHQVDQFPQQSMKVKRWWKYFVQQTFCNWPPSWTTNWPYGGSYMYLLPPTELSLQGFNNCDIKKRKKKKKKLDKKARHKTATKPMYENTNTKQPTEYSTRHWYWYTYLLHGNL